MKYLKVVLVSMLSFIAGLGAILGIMFLVGVFNKEVVEPKSIHFEQSVYNVDDDFTITIGTDTEDVTATKVTLSLSDKVSEEKIGGVTYIANNSIVIPKYVTLGQPFEVELIRGTYQEEGLSNWILGGQSTITAKSESMKADEKTVEVNVDVPVYDIQIITRTADNQKIEQDEFAMGDTFIAETKFIPSVSKFKYSTTETKQVYFEANSDNNAIVENKSALTSEFDANTTTCFDALLENSSVKVNAYVFTTSVLEDRYAEMYADDSENFVREIKNNANSIHAQKGLQFSELVVSSFGLTDSVNTEKTLPFNHKAQIFANNLSSQTSLGLVVKDSKNNKFQSQIKNIGLRVFVKTNNDKLLATSSDIVFVNSQTKVVGNNTYYMPTVMSTNVENSYWEVIAVNSAGSAFEFEFTLFDGDEIATLPNNAPNPITSHNQVWRCLGLNADSEPDLYWSSTEDINLTFIDSLDNPNPAVFDLSTLIRFTDTNTNVTNGTYRTIKYIAYSTVNADLSQVISGVTEIGAGNSKYSSLNITSTIYELQNSNLTIFASGEFEVVAVVLLSDHNGVPTDEVFKFVTDRETNTNLQPIKIIVDKTVQSIDVSLKVKGELLRNKVENSPSMVILDKLAFLQKTNESIENIFDIVFKVSANTTEDLKREVALFIEEFENGYISVFEDGSSFLKIEKPALNVDINNLTGTSWEYVLPVSAKSLEGEKDSIVRLKWEYEKTPTSTVTTFIGGGNSVEFENLTNHAYRDSDFVQIEIYDALPSSVVFGDGSPYASGYENTENTPIFKTTSILSEFVDNTNFATSVGSIYALTDGGEDISDKVVDEDGNFILTFKDKYGNEVPSSDYDIISEGDGLVSKTVSFAEGKYSSSLTQSPTATLYLYESDEGRIVDIQKNTAGIGGGEVWVSVLNDYVANNNAQVLVERYGKFESEINLFGTAGLLKVQYELGGVEYELCNIISYNLKTLLPEGILYDEENGILKVNSYLGKNTRLTFVANTGLGFTINVQLTIIPNLDATFAIEKTDPVYAELDANEIYSDSDVEVVLTLRARLAESFVLVATDYASGRMFEFVEYGGVPIASTTELNVSLGADESVTAKILVNFAGNSLGDRVLVAKIKDATSADFSKDFEIIVKPNIKLVGSEDGVIELERQVGSEPISVLTGSEYERILAVAGETQIENVRISIAETINGVPMIYEAGNLETPIQYNLFKLDAGGKIVLEPGMKILGDYVIKLNLLYNGVVVDDASITLTLTPNIMPYEAGADYENYFKNYNGKETLVLKSSSDVYNISSLKSLFANINDSGFVLSTAGTGLPYSVSGNSLQVTATKFVVFDDILTLKNDFTEITFPVAFIPVDKDFVEYETDGDHQTAIQKQNNEMANADVGFANDEAWLSANNVFDTYKSGAVVSLFSENYVLTENNGTYRLTNKTPSEIYVVVHNSNGYFLKAVDYFRSGANIFPYIEFNLSDLSTFSAIDQSKTGSLNSTTTEVVGVFASSEVFNDSTKLSQKRGYGLSNDVFNYLSSNYSHNVRLFGEDGMELAGYIFDKKSGFVQFNNSTTDVFAYAKFIDNSDTAFLVYRIFVEANSQINVYYPYSDGIASGDEEEAEYVYKTNANRITVDFGQKLESKFPNSGDLYRIMLQNGNAESGFVNSRDYTIAYSIYEVWQNGSKLSDREIILSGIELIDGVLSMPKDFNGEVVVKASVTLDSNSQDMGSVLYRVIANYEAISDYVLRVGQDKFTSTALEIAYGQAFDFSNIELYKYITNNSSEGVALAPSGFLKYHVYSNEGINLDEYFDFDLSNKTISVKDTLTIVNDIKINFVFYTIYGAIHSVELTFKSTILYEYKTNDLVSVNAGVYEVLADQTFDFANVFAITDNGNTITLSGTDFMFSVDGGEYTSGSGVFFKQNDLGQKRVSVKVLLADKTIGGKTYDADYVFETTFVVLESLRANYAQNAPMKIGGELTNEIIYTADTLVFEDKLFGDLNTANTLFSSAVSAGANTIEQYGISWEIRENNTFIETVDINISENKFSVEFTGAPKLSTSITIIFTLSKGDVTLESFANFNLIPDLALTCNYPFEDEIQLGKEALFLDGKYVKGVGEWGAYGYAQTSLNGTNYFGENCITFTSTETNSVVQPITLGERVKVSVKSVGGYLVVRSGDLFGTDIQNVAFNSNFQFQWNSASAVSPNATESVVFGVFVDGIEVETYTITFYADMAQIFSLDVNYLYDLDAGYETFYVENDNSEALFSNQTTLFSFHTRSDLRQTLSLEAWANDEKVGEITISGDRAYDWLLVGTKEITKENLSFKVDGEDTEYILASGSAYTFLFREDSIAFTSRIEISYMKKVVLSGSQLNDVKVGDSGSSTLTNFTISKYDESKIGKLTNVPLKVRNQTIGYYTYTLVYDVKIGKNYESSEQPNAIYAGDTAIGREGSGLAEFGITRLDGQPFTEEYFANHNVTFSIETIMVVGADFENNPTASNVRYYYSGMQNYANQIVEGGLDGVRLGTNYYVTTNIKYIGDATSNPKYDFYIEGNGAEASGNVVYLLFKFYATGTDFFTYDILKVEVQPGVVYNFVNDEANPSTTQNSNTSGGRFVINYTQGTTTFDDIELATQNVSKINIESKNSTSNLAVSSTYSYEVKGDIVGYVEIERINDVSVTLVQGDKLALYGSKVGYVLVKDSYGFEMRYYLEISASSDYALRLPDADLDEGSMLLRPNSNDPNLKNFNIYEGTEIQVVDKNTARLELEEGQCAVAVVNLDKIINELHFSYTVAYRLSELGFAQANTTPGDALYNRCVLPILTTDSSVSGVLDVIITIQKADNTTEVVTLSFEVQVIKRYTVGAVENASIRESVAFDVSNFISVSDKANNELALGNTEVSGETYTLVVDSSLAGSTMTVVATPQSGAPVVETIIAGKNANGVSMTSSGGKFYQLLQTYTAFAGLDLTAYSLSIQEKNISASLYAFEEDIVVSLITSKISSTESVNVNVNNGSYKIQIPFVLDLSGKQTKSVREVIQNLAISESEKAKRLENIHDYIADAEVISSYDTQKIKNFTIYNDNLTLKVEAGCVNLVFDVRVFVSASEYKSATFIVANNFAHFYNLSISNIVGDMRVDTSYKVQIVYDWLVGDYLNIGNYASLVTFADGFNSHTEEYDDDTHSCVYTKTMNAFTISAVEYDPDSRMYEDEIKVLSANEFSSGDNYTTIVKHYLVKYSNDGIIVKVPVSYSVTPKYYRLSNFGNVQDSTNFIYTNQYEVLTTTSGENYKVDFDVWASEFTLLDRYSAVLATLNICKEDLEFDIVLSGSGSAVLNENYDIITADGFNFDQFLNIAVKVKVNNDPSELVTIGNVYVQLSQSELYVETTGKYTVTLTSPTMGDGSKYTINGEYDFKKNVESIYDILASNSFADLYDPSTNKIRFDIAGGSSQQCDLADCSFAVVTVVDGIYSAVYNNENLDIKLKINENQTSVNKDITLRAVAVKIGLSGFTYVSNNFDVTVNYSNSKYFVSAFGKNFEKGADGYFTVSVKISDIFSAVFVPTDYNYTINIIDVSVTDFNVVYTNDDIEANIDDTLFFNLAYKVGGENKTQIIGLKYTQDAMNFGGSYGYSINIKDLNLGEIETYTVYFLGGYDLELADSTEYNLLVKIKQGFNSSYSLAHIPSYKNSGAFAVDDWAKRMSYLTFSGSTVSVYTNETIALAGGNGYLPKYLNLNENASVNTVYYYGVYTTSIAQMQLLGFMTNTAGKVMIDLSDYSNSAYVSIYDAESAGVLDSTAKALSSAQTYPTNSTIYWIGDTSGNSIKYTKTTMTRTDKAVNGVIETILTFSANPILLDSNVVPYTKVLPNETLPIGEINNIGTADLDKMYSFSLLTDNGGLVNFAVRGSDLNVNLESIRGYATYSHYVEICLQDVEMDITTAGTYKFAVYNYGDIVGVKAISYRVVDGKYFIASDSPRVFDGGGYSSAVMVENNEISIAVPQNVVYYVAYTGESEGFIATYFTTTTAVNIDISSVDTAGEEMRIVLGHNSMPKLFTTDDTLQILVDVNAEPLHFVLSDGVNSKDVVINAGETSASVSLADFTSAVRLSLVVDVE